ncbi:NAD(P)/FAD-dependent oxidoreductase [Gammaproteobacteria bacterium]|nr:NAD(P)/FAD-dependent oxidoreductase [Gammaproteobacteria bacterium]
MIDAVIIGGGVIGLSIARELLNSGRETIVLEKNERAGDVTSSRNSGVIHAGIYYPENFLKTKLCVEGNRLIYDYAEEKKINHKKYGKYIIASNKNELSNLEAILVQGKKNNVMISIADNEKVLENNPGLVFHKALYSPTSGVIDVPEYVTALEGDIQHFGGLISLRTSFIAAKKKENKFIVTCSAEDEFSIVTKYLINCSGLSNEVTLRNIEDFPRDKIYKNYFAKGHYFKYSGKSPFSNLIYPVSGQHSLGIHVGFDLAGGMRFGPDVEFVNEIDYSFNESLKDKFIESISQYWPDINTDKLHPDYTGIRPKITKPNENMRDFSIQTITDHGIDNFINLQGIESPGLTSSLAIGKFIKNLL